MGSDKKIRVARIGAAHGVRGESKLWSFTQEPSAVADYAPLENEDGTRQFEIESMRAAKDHFVVRLKGIDSREAAEALRNTDLFVTRDKLPPLDDDGTFYHADIVGLAAVTRDGVPVGTVSALHNFGAGDLIEIVTTAGGDPLLLPFTDVVVPEIDLASRRIVVVLPNVIE
jgi:16S rRNA processing protein RimM